MVSELDQTKRRQTANALCTASAIWPRIASIIEAKLFNEVSYALSSSFPPSPASGGANPYPQTGSECAFASAHYELICVYMQMLGAAFIRRADLRCFGSALSHADALFDVQEWSTDRVLGPIVAPNRAYVMGRPSGPFSECAR